MKPTDLADANSYRARQPQPNGVDGDRVNLLRAAWRQRWVILPSIVLGLAAALIYLCQTPPTYASSGRLYVYPTVAPLANPLPAGRDSSNYLNLQCEIIKSTQVVDAAVKMQQVKRLPTALLSGNPTRMIQEHLKAEVDARNDLISVTYESADPATGSVIVNAIIDSYVSSTIRQHRKSTAEALQVLEREKSICDEHLLVQAQQIRKFREANSSLTFSAADRRSNLAVEAVAHLADALNAAKLTTIDATLVYDAILRRSKMNLPAGTVVNDPLLRDELIRLSEQREVMRARMGENSQDVQSLDSARDRLQEGMAAQDSAAIEERLESARQARDAAAARQAAIEEQLNAEKQSAISVAAAEVQYAALDAELQRDRRMCDELEARIHELNVAKDAPPSSIAILEPANASAKLGSPQRLPVVAGGTLLGLLLGGALAGVRAAVSERVGLMADEIESQLGIPVLGCVPHSPAATNLRVCGRLAALRTQNEVGDAYRSIRTMILFGIPGEFKMLLVTSPCAGDGKTSAATNLAIAFAQSGKKTLLIDADLRRPSVDKVFVDASKVGISEVVAMRVKLCDAIQHTDVSLLRVLHAGALAPNPLELLSGRRFAELLAAVSGVYDKIIIDSPPLGLAPDAQILAANVDATVLVVRAGRSSRPDSDAAVRRLASVNAKIVGVILNAVPQRRKKGDYLPAALSATNVDLKPAGPDRSDIPSVAPKGESSY